MGKYYFQIVNANSFSLFCPIYCYIYSLQSQRPKDQSKMGGMLSDRDSPVVTTRTNGTTRNMQYLTVKNFENHTTSNFLND